MIRKKKEERLSFLVPVVLWVFLLNTFKINEKMCCEKIPMFLLVYEV